MLRDTDSHLSEVDVPYKDPVKQREYARVWAANRRRKYTEGMVCVDCGSTRNLEMDHRDPAEKVSHRIWTWAEPKLLAELSKCEPRCQTCHRARHQADRPQHGTEYTYRRGCRCDDCRTANTLKAQRYKARLEARADDDLRRAA
jgi:hypothetical protein